MTFYFSQSFTAPGFDDVLPRLQDHVASTSGYRKNAYPELPAELRRQVHASWKQSFDEWGYPSV